MTFQLTSRCQNVLEGCVLAIPSSSVGTARRTSLSSLLIRFETSEGNLRLNAGNHVTQPCNGFCMVMAGDAALVRMRMSE